MSVAFRTAGKVALPLGVAALAAGAIVYGPNAFADDSDPNLPGRTAEEVVAKIAGAKPEALSGSVRITTDLGLPALPGKGDASPNALLSGTHTLRVAVDGPDRQRIGIQADLAEYNIVHNGRDLWTYDSRSNTATHTTLPEGAADAARNGVFGPLPSTAGLAATPQEAAKQLLAAVGPSTSVTVAGTGKVAGRPVYELRIAPGQPGSLIGGATVSVDSETGVPLRVVVDTAKGGKPAVDVGFTEVSFKAPDRSTFDFKPPSGAKVVENNDRKGDDAKDIGKPDFGKLTAALDGKLPRIHGTGWNTVVEIPLPAGTPFLPGADGGTNDKNDKNDKKGSKENEEGGSAVADLLRKAGTPVSGPWGSGTLFSTRLVTVLATDDGRVFAGAVDGATLQGVAAADTGTAAR
ncbi:LolA family protein [Yinghuangia soli]|uniref:DUF2092 domain-containing protein n=1 Tax=Yinghuangia soli TaxID=2908204 RepID=A0AA41U454_9ACTN|nr:DUF2092 domain-containing protein [Yinghuangia soli]MCF2532515.1 DUF2092 domain-containing protein [Yinghuangia soli]